MSYLNELYIKVSNVMSNAEPNIETIIKTIAYSGDDKPDVERMLLEHPEFIKDDLFPDVEYPHQNTRDEIVITNIQETMLAKFESLKNV